MKPVALAAEVGKGVVIATTMFISRLQSPATLVGIMNLTKSQKVS
jgi:hypothetical protein